MNIWYYQNEPYLIAPEDQFGFVYCIHNIVTGQKYIGKKQFWSDRSKKITGRKNRKHFRKESDWKDYWGSCEELKTDVKSLGEENFYREILQMYPTKGELTYGEVEHQIKKDVLSAKLPNGNRAYYNKNIMSRWFVKPDQISEETRKRMSLAQTGRKVSETTKQKISKSLTGKSKEPFSDIHKLHISDSKKGSTPWNKNQVTGVGGPKGQPKTEDHKEKLSKSLKDQNIQPVTCNNPKTEDHKSKIRNTLAQKWKLQDPQGNIIEITGLKQYCKDNDLSYKTLQSTLQEKRPAKWGKCKGWMLLHGE